MSFGFGFGITAAGKAGFSPASLFSLGEQGVWYDPSDLSTMYQDSAGTTPVTGLEQPVGRIEDKSGNGHHATQSTSTARPVLRARYNLLTFSEQFDNAAWTKVACSITANATTAPDGTTTADLCIPSTSSGQHYLQSTSTSQIAGASYTCSVYAKDGGYRYLRVGPGNSSAAVCFDLQTGTVSAETPSNAGSITSAGNGWYRCSVTGPATSTTSAGMFLSVNDSSSTSTTTYTGDGTSGIYIWGAQLVANSVFPQNTYQRIEAAPTGNGTVTYATGADFPPYLAFDGSDDAMATASINFTATDEMSVFAGVTKNSDAAVGHIAELSSNYLSNNGSFLISGPDDTAAATYGVGLRSSATAYTVPSVYASPITNVLAVVYDISGASVTAEINSRVNGVLNQSGAGGLAGTGNFGNYPLYIGARGGTSLFFNGRLYQLIVRGKTSTADEINNTEAYVAQKTGVTL